MANRNSITVNYQLAVIEKLRIELNYLFYDKQSFLDKDVQDKSWEIDSAIVDLMKKQMLI